MLGFSCAPRIWFPRPWVDAPLAGSVRRSRLSFLPHQWLDESDSARWQIGGGPMTKIRVIALAVATAMTAAITFVPGTSTAHQRATRDSDFQRVRIHGHPAEHPNWTVGGHMNVRRFVLRNGEVRAVARITDAVLRRANGNVVRRLDDPQRAVFRVTLPTSGGSSTAHRRCRTCWTQSSTR